MIPQPANPHSGPAAHALVLGPRCVAELIARALAEQGYLARAYAGEQGPLPLPSQPDSPARLAALLDAFAASLPPVSPGRAHLLHPGCSLGAARPEIFPLAQARGLQVVAPPARVVSLFGNKLNLLTEAGRAGVPHLVLDADPLSSVREAQALFERLGRRTPFVLKSVRGGGSLGVFVVHAPEDLEHKLPLWMEQLRRAVGEVLLFGERYVEGARQITVPFARFHDGRFRAFPCVDASLQSRWRKIVEFCPAEGLGSALERRLVGWTRKVAERTQFVGVGALEFLVDGERGHLVEGVARLGAGYGLWESVAGTSAVAWQLATAQGATAEPATEASREGRAGLAARILCEDPLLQLPQPGVVREVSEARRWRYPGAEAALELPLEAGLDVGREGTSLLGLLRVRAGDRRQAVTLARGVLDEIWISGTLQTNERFLAELLRHPWVREGMFHAGFLDEEFVPALRPEAELLRGFASVGAVAAAEREAGEGAPRARWAVADQWMKPDADALRWAVGPVRWQDRGMTGVSGELRLEDGRSVRVCAAPVLEDRWLVRLGAWVLVVRRVPAAGAEPLSVLPPGTHRLASLANGRVHSLRFRPESHVPAHEPLAIVEALGALVPHALPVDAVLFRWTVGPEAEVHAGQELALFRLASAPQD